MKNKIPLQRIELYKLFFLYLILFLILFSLGYKIGLRGFVVSEPIHWIDLPKYLKIISFRSLFGATAATVLVWLIRKNQAHK